MALCIKKLCLGTKKVVKQELHMPLNLVSTQFFNTMKYEHDLSLDGIFSESADLLLNNSFIGIMNKFMMLHNLNLLALKSLHNALIY